MSEGVIDDFPVEVEGVGSFRFKRRTIRHQIQIEAEARRITGGPCDDPQLTNVADALAALEVLTTSAPDGWNIKTIDVFDPENVGRMIRVYGGLREKEATFRKGSGPERAGVGSAT